MSENETTVVETPEVDVESTTTQEEVTSPEVKTEVPTPEATPEPVQKEDSSAKMQSQVENLNTALKQEREARKAQEAALAESKETIDKLKNVFTPEQPEETQESNVTMDQIESLLDKRDESRREETQKETQAQTIKKEIGELEKEWDGADGKPKYEDKKVLQWQEDNSKLHLSPREAFNEMSRDTIIDYEIKARMAKKPDIQNVETPGGTPTTREPQEKTPSNTTDLRGAIFEAMDNVADENIN